MILGATLFRMPSHPFLPLGVDLSQRYISGEKTPFWMEVVYHNDWIFLPSTFMTFFQFFFLHIFLWSSFCELGGGMLQISADSDLRRDWDLHI